MNRSGAPVFLGMTETVARLPFTQSCRKYHWPSRTAGSTWVQTWCPLTVSILQSFGSFTPPLITGFSPSYASIASGHAPCASMQMVLLRWYRPPRSTMRTPRSRVLTRFAVAVATSSAFSMLAKGRVMRSPGLASRPSVATYRVVRYSAPVAKDAGSMDTSAASSHTRTVLDSNRVAPSISVAIIVVILIGSRGASTKMTIKTTTKTARAG